MSILAANCANFITSILFLTFLRFFPRLDASVPLFLQALAAALKRVSPQISAGLAKTARFFSVASAISARFIILKLRRKSRKFSFSVGLGEPTLRFAVACRSVFYVLVGRTSASIFVSVSERLFRGTIFSSVPKR